MNEKNGNVNTNPWELAKADGLILRAIVELEALRPITKAQSMAREAAIKNLKGWQRYSLFDLKKVF